MNDPVVEAIAEKVHEAWRAEKQRQGFADHVLARYESPRWKAEMLSKPCASCDVGRDKHHTDMLPYADLPEHVKEYDRVTVRAVLAATGYLLEKGLNIDPRVVECSECGQRYKPSRRVRENQRRYCPDCATSGARERWASQAHRERKKV